VHLKETEGAPLATGATQFVGGAIDFIVAARFEAFAAPPVHLASAWPKTILWPVVGTSTSPIVAILLWAVKGEVKL